MKQTIGVIIPTYKPDIKLRKLLLRLQAQHRRPDNILVINTDEKQLDRSLLEGMEHIRLVHIEKEDFDHGGTRNLGAQLMETDLLIYMTMDALPADKHLIGNLAAAFDDPQTACACARQLPGKDADILERYTRHFNYPAVSRVKTKADLEELGIKTYFCSNACAAYRRDLFLELGQFTNRTIFNEDMIFAAGAIQAGYSVAYCADARVIHSHSYTGLQQFRRNFDLGVSQAEHPEVFAAVKSESEGMKLVKQEALWLLRHGYPEKLPVLLEQSACKYIGYRLGKGYGRLPGWLIEKLTMNRTYWNRNS